MSDFTNIKIKGQYFEQETTLQFFDDGKIASAVYGKNGSGKSTISKAFNAYKNGENSFEQFELLNKNNKLSNQKKDNIWVFNEEFIDKNIKFSTNGSMDAIVMFGESIDIDSSINDFNDKIKSEEDAIEKRNYNQYSVKNGDKNVEELKKKIREILKSGWGSRKNAISNKNQAITENVFEQLLEIEKPSKSQKELSNQYNDLLDRINKSRNSSIKIDLIKEFTIAYEKTDLENVLNKHYEKKDNSELATLIYSKMKSNEFNKTSFDFMMKDDNSICPTCFQKVSTNRKLELKQALDEIDDEEIKNYKTELEHRFINVIPDNLPNDVSIFNSIQVANFKDLKAKICKEIEKINDFIKSKKDNPYINKNIDCLDFFNFTEQCNKLVDDLNHAIKTYNSDIDLIDNNIKTINSLNDQLSYFEIHEEKEKYLKLKEEKEKCLEEDEASKQRIKQYQDEIDKLNSKKSNTDIALEGINEDLAFILIHKNRLYLKSEADGFKYKVYSKGKKINLNQLSTGERNLISLCYYFNSIKKNKKDTEAYEDEMLLVIDDPVSSFDFENKLGILSYLKKMFKNIHEKNGNTKFIVFTHDFNMWLDIYEILKDFVNNKAQKSRLYNKQLAIEKDDKNSNYQELLSETYAFANGDLSDEFSIGNTMRRLLEAYSTFNYKIGMRDLFKKEEILDKIKDDKLRDYFSNRLYRLVLNGESHTENIMKGYPDTFLFDTFSLDEKILTAKDILVYLYCLDEYHIKQYLKENYVVIEEWKNKIPKDLL